MPYFKQRDRIGELCQPLFYLLDAEVRAYIRAGDGDFEGFIIQKTTEYLHRLRGHFSELRTESASAQAFEIIRNRILDTANEAIP